MISLDPKAEFSLSCDLCCGSLVEGFQVFVAKDQGKKTQGCIWFLRKASSNMEGKDLRETLTPSLSFQRSAGVSAVGSDFLLGARLSASRPLSCDICSSSQELGHKLPFFLAFVQGGLEAMRKRIKGG